MLLFSIQILIQKVLFFFISFAKVLVLDVVCSFQILINTVLKMIFLAFGKILVLNVAFFLFKF